jgi:hypothetical protein
MFPTMNKTINYIPKITLLTAILFLSVTVFSQSMPDTDIKRNIVSIDEPLQKLVLLEPKIFEYETTRYKHLQLPHGRQYGFLAENVQDVLPDMVWEKSVSYLFGKNLYRNATIKMVDAVKLIPLLVSSIKEQQLQIAELKTAIEELKSRIK